jgi:hypothetical protein
MCQYGETRGQFIHIVELQTEGRLLKRAIRQNMKYHYGQFQMDFFMDQLGVSGQVALPRSA